MACSDWLTIVIKHWTCGDHALNGVLSCSVSIKEQVFNYSFDKGEQMTKQFKIAEIADMFNVSRASVNRAIDKLDSEIDFKLKFVHSSGKAKTAPKLVDEAGIGYLSNEFGSRPETDEVTSSEQSELGQTLRVLIRQIEEKDSQIAEKDRQIQKLQESEKDLRDLLKAQAGQLLQINSGVQALSDASDSENKQEENVVKSKSEQAGKEKVNLFGRIFGRKQ